MVWVPLTTTYLIGNPGISFGQAKNAAWLNLLMRFLFLSIVLHLLLRFTAIKDNKRSGYRFSLLVFYCISELFRQCDNFSVLFIITVALNSKCNQHMLLLTFSINSFNFNMSFLSNTPLVRNIVLLGKHTITDRIILLSFNN